MSVTTEPVTTGGKNRRSVLKSGHKTVSSTPAQMAAAMKMVKKPVPNAVRYEKITREYVYALNGQYEMNP